MKNLRFQLDMKNPRFALTIFDESCGDEKDAQD